MDKTKLLENVEVLTLYTGTYGRKKCTCSCIGCTQESYGRKHEDFQGNLGQIKTIIEKLPNLQDAYILGNPDVSVDTEFCNQAAKEFIKHGRKVMFSTSGFDGVNVIKKLTDGIEAKDISYISYSIDTMDDKKLQYLKGNKNMQIKEIDKAISYCIEHGITVKIQPTLWEINQDDYKEIINHYEKMGIKWFTFHAGSFEALESSKIPIKHIKPNKWREIVKDINKIARERDLKLKAPKIFLNTEENVTYLKNHKVYCQNGGRGLQIWMQKDGLKATFCPVLSEICPGYTFDLEKEEAQIIEKKNNYCLICSKCIDENVRQQSINREGTTFFIDDEILHNICRYYSDKIKYG